MSRVVPILFNGDMVRAILDGRKTVTRRMVKLPKYIKLQDDGLYTLFAEGECYENKRLEEIVAYLSSPYQPGDILYVRETWSEWTDGYLYKAWTSPFPQPGKSSVMKWHPSIHMPKEASRIWLKVKDVRVERLQEITEDEAVQEGIYTSNCKNCNAPFGCDACPDEGYDEIDEFVELWNSTIKKSDLDRYGWDANPWVWVIEFERCEKPDNF